MRIMLSATGSSSVISAVKSISSALGGGGLGNALSNLSFGFRNLKTEGNIGIGAITQGLSGLGKTFLLVGGIAAAAGVAIAVAIGTKAVKAAGDFQQGLTTLVTGAGELESNLGLVSSGILKMAVDTGTSTSQLVSGMFQIESAGYRGSQALRVMDVSAQGAKVGHADLGITAKAVTGVMLDYSLGVNKASDAMNFLTAIVQNGQTNLQDLGAAMPAILPTASSLGVQLRDVGAAMATMTAETVPAADASTYLRQLLMALAAPAKAGQKALQDIGLSAQQVSDGMKKSLPETLKLIMTHLAETYKVGSPQYVEALKAIAGGSKQMQGILDLTGSHMTTFAANVNNISGVMEKGKGSVVGWAQVQQDFNFKMDQAKQALNVFMIQLGTKLLPIFGQLMSALLPVLTAFLQWVTNSGILQGVLQTLVNVIIGMVHTGSAIVSFFKNNEVAMDALKATLGVLAVIIGVAMVVALYNMAAAAFTAMIPFLPLIAVILVIIAVVTAVILVVQHWGQIAHWLQGIWANVVGFFKTVWLSIQVSAQVFGQAFMAVFTPIANVFKAIWNGIVTVLTVAWNIIKMVAFVIFVIIVDLIIAPFLPLIDWFKAHWAQIHAALTAVWNAIKVVAAALWAQIKQHIITPVVEVISALQTAWNTISKAATTAWNMVSKGIQKEWNAFIGIVQGPINTVISWLEAAWKRISDAAKKAWKQLSDDIGAIFGGIITGIKWVINQVINLVNNIIGGINSVSSHVGIPAIPLIPHLATGGILTHGGLVQVGEFGAETVALPAGAAVYPHGSVPAGAGGGPMTIINISISTMARSQSEVARMVDLVEQEIGRRFRTQTNAYNSGNVF